MDLTGARTPSIRTQLNSATYVSPKQRPIVSTSVDSFKSTASRDHANSPQITTTPEAINFYRQRAFPSASNAITPPSADRNLQPSSFRSASGPALTSVKSSPTLSTDQHSNPNFKNLVAQFNTASYGEIPPLPTQTSTRSSSAMAGLHMPRTNHISTPSSPPISPRARLHKSPPRKAKPFFESKSPGSDENVSPLGSNSTSHLSKAHRRRTTQSSQSGTSMPLFGEVLDIAPDSPDAGFGIPRDRLRRTSDGNMHSPNAMFTHSRNISDVPISPSRPDGGYHLHSNIVSDHQRSTSEDAVSHPQVPMNLDVLRDILPNHNLQTLDHLHPWSSKQMQPIRRVPVGGRPRTPSPSISPPTLTSDVFHTSIDTPKLQATITAPSPKVSPRLRSSRPRQQVSAAGSTAALNDSAAHFMSTNGRSNDTGSMRASPEKRRVSAVKDMDFAQRRKSIRLAMRHADTVDSLQIPSRNGTPFEEHEEAIVSRSPSPSGTSLLLSNAVYQKPAPKLTVNTFGLKKPTSKEPLTGNTDFEVSPLSNMPGAFPSEETEENVQPMKQTGYNSIQATPLEAFGKNFDFSSPGISRTVDELRRDDQALDPHATAAGNPASPEVEEEAGTIQIMLGSTPILNGQSQLRRNYQHSFGADEANARRPSLISSESSNLTPSWKPANIESKHTHKRSASSRITLDGDAYTVINRVVDQYRESGIISPQMVEDFQKHIIETDPDYESIGQDDATVARIALGEIIKDSLSREEFGQQTNDNKPRLSPAITPNGGPTRYIYNSLQAQAGQREAVTPVLDPYSFPARDTSDRSNSSFSSDNYDNKGYFPQQPDYASPSPPSLQAHTYSPIRKASIDPSTNMSTSRGPSLPEIEDTDGNLEFTHSANHTPRPSQMLDDAQTPVQTVRSQTAQPMLDATSDEDEILRGQQILTPRSFEDSTPTPIPDPSKAPNVSSLSTSDDQGQVAETEIVPPTKEERRLAHRRNLIKELIDTEYTYSQDMQVVEDIYMGTAGDHTSLTPDDVAVLFANIPYLVKLSNTMATALREATKGIYIKSPDHRWRIHKQGVDSENRDSFATSHSSSQLDPLTSTEEERDRRTYVGEVFGQKMKEIEKAYGEYLRNHDMANQRLQRLQQNPKVALWLNECHNYACDITEAWDLDSLLVKPTQRILKYPLLLHSLVENTPEDHPDYTALRLAHKEILQVSHRINESKRRAEILDRVVNTRKGKESDGTIGIVKAFGRRTEKLRQQVGITDAVEDLEYKAIAEKFGGHTFQLGVALRDMELYKRNGESFMTNYKSFVESMEQMIDVGPTSHSEIESKWRKYAMTVRELISIAWVDHAAAIQKHCIDPIINVSKLHERPAKLMQKRKKRIMDFAKFKAMKERGDKPDKKLVENSEQYTALNDSLKDELPKLYTLTGKLVTACLKNFIDIMAQFNATWHRKIATSFEDQLPPKDMAEIIKAFESDYQYPRESMNLLGIASGQIVGESSEFLAPSPNFASGDSKRPSTIGSSRRTESVNSQQSFGLATPDAKQRGSGNSNFMHAGANESRTSTESGTYVPSANGYAQFQRQNGYSRNHNLGNPIPAVLTRPRHDSDSGTFFVSDPTPPLSAANHRSSAGSGYIQNNRPASSSTKFSTSNGNDAANANQNGTPPSRQSGVFNSYNQLYDSATSTRPSSISKSISIGQQDYKVRFVAASLFPFSIDKARKESGYPFLEYLPGEVFDIIDVTGELWLAKNQDSDDAPIGWIWDKHFAYLPITE